MKVVNKKLIWSIFVTTLMLLLSANQLFLGEADGKVIPQSVNEVLQNEMTTEFSKFNSTLSDNKTLQGASSPGYSPNSETPIQRDPPVTPSFVANYVPVTVTNHQSEPTSDPFNMLVNVNSNAYSPLESQGLENVIWFTSNGSIIPSWIESGNSIDSTQTQYWLKVPFKLGEYSSITIFMGFAKKGSNLFNPNGYEGEAPQLSTSYGQYDNGNMVFPGGYWNFNGNTLPSGWQWTNSQSPEGNSSVDNGLIFTFPGTWWYTRGAATSSSADHGKYALYTYQMTTSYTAMNTMFGELTSYGGSVQSYGYQSVIHGYSGVLSNGGYTLEYSPGTNNGGTIND